MVPGDLAFDPAEARTRAAPPDFLATLRWVNRADAVHRADLRGRAALVVFWNGTGASSERLWRVLSELRDRHPERCVLLGVHTPRYASQRSDEAVRHAASRLAIRAPVANDCDWLAWRANGISAWPTTLVLDADGRLAARFAGADRAADIEATLTRLPRGEGGAADDAAPLAIDAPAADPAETLAYPTQPFVAADRLFVSDTGHHRVLECALGGRVLRHFGSGTPGHFDGNGSASGFHSPRGLAGDAGSIYVADTGNDAIRRIHLDTGDVETIYGTGAPAYDAPGSAAAGPGAVIDAPWGLALGHGVLHIAAAGQRQILRADLRTGRIAAIAGDGRHAVRDGTGAEASFAQPSALALAPGQLLVADAGGNAIRRLRLADLALTTLVGGSPWEAGCADGVGRAARCAFPGGIAVGGDAIYIADTCNDRLCRLDRFSGALETLPLGQLLHHPLGLAFAGGALWVADCHAHAILKLDPASGACVRVPVAE